MYGTWNAREHLHVSFAEPVAGKLKRQVVRGSARAANPASSVNHLTSAKLLLSRPL